MGSGRQRCSCPRSAGALRRRKAGAWSTDTSNLHASFGSGSGRGADRLGRLIPGCPRVHLREGGRHGYVGGAFYRAMVAASAQVAAAAPRCAWPARPARPARQRCPLACAGEASGGDGGQWEAALQLPAVDGASRPHTAGAPLTASSNLHASFGSGSGRGAN